MADKRLTYIRKWFQRGMKTKDVFDRFFCLWIAMVVAVQRFATQHPADNEKTDREKLLAYFRGNADQVFKVLEDNPSNMGWLARRRGTNYGGPIVDTGNEELRNKFSRLVSHYTEGAHLSRQELAENTAEVLNKVRNNVFHGVKVYDDMEDVELLAVVNPILRDVLRKLEGLGVGKQAA